MIKYLCHSEIFPSSIYLMVRCSFIYSLFTRSCQAVFSATLRATWPSHLLLLHGAATPGKFQCCSATQATGHHTHTHAHTVHPKCSYTSEHIEWADQLKIERDIVIICLVSRASHAPHHVTVLWKVFTLRAAWRPTDMKWTTLYCSHASSRCSLIITFSHLSLKDHFG